MVTWQIERRGVFDSRVLEAMRTIPRHVFVPSEYQDEAYADYPLPIGHGQTISQPYIVALMSALLDLHPHDKVLEVGTGSGYQAAILSRLVQRVISMECIPLLAETAQESLGKCAITNVKVICGDGSCGYPEEAPYNGILVAACAPNVPVELIDQLCPGGILVIPVGDRSMQTLQVWRKTLTGDITSQEHIPVVFVPLRGKRGFNEEL